MSSPSPSLLQTLSFLGWYPLWNAVQNVITCGGVLHKPCLPEFLPLAWNLCLMLSYSTAHRTSTNMANSVSPFDLIVVPLRSLLPMCPLRWLLGDLVPSSQRANFLLAHKLPLMKVPSSSHAVFTLVGYLAGCSKEEEEGVLGKTLQSVLGVWSDASALRHMDLRQHLWLSRVTVLGVACLSAGQRAKLKPGERGSVCLLTEALFCGYL